MTSIARSRRGRTATPWTSTASPASSASSPPAWCSRVSSPWWRAGGHGGKDPGFPPRRYSRWMDGWRRRRRNNAEVGVRGSKARGLKGQSDEMGVCFLKQYQP